MTGGSPLPMTASEMLSEARKLTGIQIEDTAAIASLEVLVDGFNRDGGFTAEGALAKHDYLMRFLKNRLRMQRDLAANPEIERIEILPPIVINALARTGSTKLQKVLSVTGDFNWLPMWQVLNPASWTGEPNEDVGPRIDDIDRFIGWHRRASPQSQAAHAMIVDAPEESSSIMMHSLVSSTLTGYANAPSYLDWCFTQDQSLQFQYVHRTMQYLIWQGLADPTKPFVLKSAMSVGFEDGLLAAHGHAHLLMTHRHPCDFIPSTCKLIEVFRKAYSDQQVDHSGLLPGIAALVDLHIDFRRRRLDVPVMDIHYDTLMDDVTGLVERIYAFCGKEPGPNALNNIANWENKNPKNKHGSFEYYLEQFGLTRQIVLDKLSNYLALTKRVGINFD
jgi:hypothetical protein